MSEQRLGELNASKKEADALRNGNAAESTKTKVSRFHPGHRLVSDQFRYFVFGAVDQRNEAKLTDIEGLLQCQVCFDLLTRPFS